MPRAGASVAILLGWALAAPAQVITTIAGNALYDRSPATQTPLNFPSGIAVDAQGNFWIADTANHVIRRVDAATGIATIVAGGGTLVDPTTPVPATSAVLEGPTFVVRDSVGNLYFCETPRHRVRKISPDGMLTTVAGTGQQGFSGDGGPALQARMGWNIWGIAVDATGNLYIADWESNRIRRVDAVTGIIQTVAGNGTFSATPDDGPALNVSVSGYFLALDNAGNLLMGDLAQNLRRFNPSTGMISTIVRSGRGYSGDGGPAANASAQSIGGVAVDAGGNIFVSDDSFHVVRRIDSASGIISTLAGSGQRGYFGRRWPGQAGADGHTALPGS